MPHAQATTRSQPLALWLHEQPRLTQAIALLLGIVALAAASQVSVPMVPVPMTLQTLAVTLVGAVYGWRLGVLTLVAWLALGALGLPVFAGGKGGLSAFLGPTAGYLLAFPVAGGVVGWLVARGWDAARPVLALLAMLIGTALCLLIGGGWLASSLGLEKALAVGVTPFLLGGLLKSVLGAALLYVIDNGTRRVLPR